MINRLTTAALAIALIGGGGTLALAVTGSPDNGSNAAISQYETVPTTPPGGGELPTTQHEGHGVKGVHESGGKPNHGGSGPGSAGGEPGGKSRESGPVETPSTGPVSAAGGLPFTGFDALALAGVGLLLLLAGMAQRRFESKRRE